MQLLRRPTTLSLLALATVTAWWMIRASNTNELYASVRPDLLGVTTNPPRSALEQTLDAGPASSQPAPIVSPPVLSAVEATVITPVVETIVPPEPVVAPTAPIAVPTSETHSIRGGNGFTARGQDAAGAPTQKPDSTIEMNRALDLVAANPIEARQQLSTMLLSGTLAPADARLVADALNAITEQIFLTPVCNAHDTTCSQYTIRSGDALSKIVKREKLACDWRLVKRMNNLKSESAIREGQRLKLPRGTFHAVVQKRDYRLDLVLETGTERVIVACFPVGLGSSNGTPLGRFRVRPQSKLVNPEWTHPVTGEHYAAEDPRNPIGEHWLGLEGVDATNRELVGYGIHGTVDPSSIGQDMSLGCVRMLDTDVAIVWECLTEPNSTIEIR